MRAVGRGGFTLVELLVTVTIIAILATLVFGALHVAREQARATKTKALIAKLDRVVMDRYESYRTRRVPINTSGLPPSVAAVFRLRGVRELMRMEMPERLNDITDPGSRSYVSDPPVWADQGLPVIMNVQIPDPSNPSGPPITFTRQMSRTAQARSFFRRVMASMGDANYEQFTYDSAEYLYVMVSLAGARDQFRDSEIADVDQDGWKEFVDGWGNPIEFLRWAPGFTESDIQARTFFPNGSPPPPFAPRSADVAAAALSDHDPFDSRNMHTNAYRLVPLIYSAGPDGIYDIDRDRGYVFQGDPYDHDPFSYGASGYTTPNDSGEPINDANVSATATGPANGSLDHYDNIHNHRREAD